MLIDVHAHLDFVQFDSDRDAVIRGLGEEGIIVINSGIGPGGIEKTIGLVDRYDGVLATLGLSPRELNQGVVDETVRLIRKYRDRIVGIGEVGLDYYWVKESEGRRTEIKNFDMFIKLARELNLPLVVHSRDAERDVITKLKEENMPALLHCFAGSPELGKEAISFGCLISIPASIVYSKRKQKLAEMTPLNSIVIESDSPFLAPVPRERNTPSSIKLSVEKIAEVKGIGREDVAEITGRNAKRFFNLKP